MRDFAPGPDAKFGAKADAERALRGVVEYQLYVDLQRGWRVTMPNLEQTGLLKVDLPRPARARRRRGVLGGHLPAGPDQPPSSAQELGRILLDELRRVRAIDVDCLTEEGFDRLKKLSRAAPDRAVGAGRGRPRGRGRRRLPRPARAGGRRARARRLRARCVRPYLRRDAAGLPGTIVNG